MPNVKIYVEKALHAQKGGALVETLPAIRAMLCEKLNVPVDACQLSVLCVSGMTDQPQVNVEIQILPKPDRTADLVTAVCNRLQDMIAKTAGAKTAVRATALDPDTYVALK